MHEIIHSRLIVDLIVLDSDLPDKLHQFCQQRVAGLRPVGLRFEGGAFSRPEVARSAGLRWRIFRPAALYCGEGRDERFGVIEFAVSADVTAEFRKAVLAVPETDWHPLYRTKDDMDEKTDQEWAEVCYVPNWAGNSKNNADYRFIAIREPMRQLDLGDADQLPFPTQEFSSKGRFKLFGVVTNRTVSGDQVIWWLRERCGKSEEVHAVMKDDLAGGKMPSNLFGANAAWWAIMVLALNLNSIMKQLVLGKLWVTKRMKALRFTLVNLPGRVITHGRRLILRLSAAGQTLALLLGARQAILRLASAPSG